MRIAIQEFGVKTREMKPNIEKSTSNSVFYYFSRFQLDLGKNCSDCCVLVKCKIKWPIMLKLVLQVTVESLANEFQRDSRGVNRVDNEC